LGNVKSKGACFLFTVSTVLVTIEAQPSSSLIGMERIVNDASDQEIQVRILSETLLHVKELRC
jgi:hypothetical protein